jgi:probable F420-dependent oxidoreductase
MTYELPESLQRLNGTVGLWTTTQETLPAAHCGELALEIEAMGYAALWIPEAWGREAFTNSALLLSATSSLTIATGIANIWGRDAVGSAAAAKTLNAAFNDRFVLGLGVSHEPLVTRMRGHDYKKPVAAMSAYLAAMDAAPNFSPESQHRYARVIAALGPKMLEVAATQCDGAHPYLVTTEHVALARQAVGDRFVGVEQAVVLGQDREEFLRRAHAHLDIYTGLDNYRNSWKRLGFIEDDFVRGGSDRLCDAVVVHGDESVVVDKIKELHQAGANHVCLQVLGTDMFAPPTDEWRRIAEAIK